MKLKYFKNKGDQTEIVLNNITVLVGPNNVGKSQTLRDIKNLLELGKNARPIIINDADFDLPENFNDFLSKYYTQKNISAILFTSYWSHYEQNL